MSFIILADTREQQPYSFPCATNRKALAAGDYSVEGLEERVAVERKSLSDFVHTVIHDHARFGREMLLLSTYDAACVVVEADLDAVLRGPGVPADNIAPIRGEEHEGIPAAFRRDYANPGTGRRDELRGASPESVLGAALHITLRYGVPVFWCGSRQAARVFTEMYLRMAARAKEVQG
jgi:ERCC4-type nuclease